MARLTGYRVAMMDLGLETNEDWIIRQPKFLESSGYDGMNELVRRELDVTAVICHGDQIARGALTAARELRSARRAASAEPKVSRSCRKIVGPTPEVRCSCNQLFSC